MRGTGLMTSLALVLTSGIVAVAAPPEAEPWTVVGSGRMDVAALRGDVPLFILRNVLCGPGWKGSRLEGLARAEDGVRLYEQEATGFYESWWDKQPMPGTFDLDYKAEKSGPNAVRLTYVCTPDSDMTFGRPRDIGERSATIGPVLPPNSYFKDGTCEFVMADGTTKVQPLPVPMSGYQGVAAVILKARNGETTRMEFEPSLFIHCDHGELRCFSGNDVEIGAGEKFIQKITIEFPHPIAFEPANRYVDMSDWYPLNMEQAGDYATPSALGMEDWLERPAGRHGWLGMDGKDFVFEDGTPAKFWGINICGPKAAPEAADADRWADRCAKHGVNLVRFHKILNHIGSGWALDDKDDSTQLNEARAAKFDYLSAAFAERGVYYGWSQYYAYKLSAADRDRVLAYDELMAKGDRWFKGTTIMLVNFAPDLQDLHIKALLNLLNRENTVTGKRYADDRALAYIEIQNEDDIFFYGLDRNVKQCPTYYAMMKRQFSDWLKEKYGTEEAWQEAWAERTREGESLAAGNVDPFAENMYNVSTGSRRVLDLYQYLYDAQTGYYERVKKALRDAGYGGAICGSCWQTANFLGHLYNVRSDREVGFIDRHNYGGGNMLAAPGSGLLSAGMQQVSDRPFNFSEWAGGGVFGSMEMVPVIGFVGMGVQGWDASCHFASNEPGIGHVKAPVCDRFLSLAQYPSVARALYRGDLAESEPVAIRRVGIPAMADGDLGFDEHFSLLGGANIKEFSAVVPQQALAVGPVVLEFADGPVEEPVIDRSGPYIDTDAQRTASASGQVEWDYSGRGWFTVNTPGTQAFFGFGKGQEFDLENVTISPHSPVALLSVNARDKDETIASADALIITVMGRIYSEGSVVDEVSMDLIQDAENPETARQMIEPVSATIELRRDGQFRVFALDHGGKKTEPAVEVPVTKIPEGVRFVLNGAKYRSMYFLVEKGN